MALKTNLFRRYQHTHSAVEMLHESALYKCSIDINIINLFVCMYFIGPTLTLCCLPEPFPYGLSTRERKVVES